MNRGMHEDLDKGELKKHIIELRDILNEICATDESAEGLKKRLVVSQKLDKLIVKYMIQDNK